MNQLNSIHVRKLKDWITSQCDFCNKDTQKKYDASKKSAKPTYLCSDSSWINAWSASTANEKDINKRNSCLHMQHNQNGVLLAQVTDEQENYLMQNSHHDAKRT